MAFRVTNNQVSNTLIDQIFKQRREIQKSQDEIASGLKVYEASDDPGRAGTISQLQSTISRLEKHKERISFATNLLETQETVLDSAENVLVRARELATQGANGSMSTETREHIADEVFQLRDELVALANSTYQGLYVYGGAADNAEPFTPAAGGYVNPPVPPANADDPEKIRYAFSDQDGSDITRTVQISDYESVRVNTSGQKVFENAIASLERLGRSLKGYRTDLDAGTGLPDGNGTAYTFPGDFAEQTEDILEAMDSLQSAIVNEVEVERSSVGSRMNRLVQAAETIDVVLINTETARAAIQDADPFESASRISDLQNGLQALLTSAASINNLSLLNFI